MSKRKSYISLSTDQGLRKFFAGMDALFGGHTVIPKHELESETRDRSQIVNIERQEIDNSKPRTGTNPDGSTWGVCGTPNWVTHISTLTLVDGRRFSIRHGGFKGRGPSLDQLHNDWESGDALFWSKVK